MPGTAGGIPARTHVSWLLVVAAMLPGPGPEASPRADREARRLKPGVFLYAAPELRAPPFIESVVLLVSHGPDGSLGVIVNQPTRVPLREAVRDLGDVPLELALHFGGPVQPDGRVALLRSAKRVEGTRVLPDVYFTTDMKAIGAAARAPEASLRLRLYAGYAGWAPGQLAGELRRGAWVVGPADARSVFTSDPAALWPRVYELLRGVEASLQRRTSSSSWTTRAGGRLSRNVRP
jgi:putative transcriptional regulator